MVRGLWDSWDDGAFPEGQGDRHLSRISRNATCSITRASTSRSKARSTSRGRRRGIPIIMQSGSSEPGQQLAARTADVVFTAHQTSRERAGVLSRAEGQACARSDANRRTLAIMPGFLPVLGGTEKEARDKLALLDSWTDQSKVIAHAVRPAGARRLELRSRRPAAGAAGLRADAEPRQAAHRRRAARQPHAAPARPDGRDRPRPLRDVRHARADRRPDGIVVPRAAGRTASTSCRRISPAGSTISPRASSRSCKSAACSAPNTKGTTLRDHFGFARPPNRHRVAAGARGKARRLENALSSDAMLARIRTQMHASQHCRRPALACRDRRDRPPDGARGLRHRDREPARPRPRRQPPRRNTWSAIRTCACPTRSIARRPSSSWCSCSAPATTTSTSRRRGAPRCRSPTTAAPTRSRCPSTP